MAEATGLRNNALPYPVYGVPYGVAFPILDADGDLVTGAAGLDSEVSKNGDTFTDCTNEATEIATSSGVYYLLLTGTEMTADLVTIIVKTSTEGAKTTTLTLYPRKLVPLRTGTAQGGAAGYITLDASAGALNDMWNGCLCVAVIDSNTEARIIDDYDGSTQQASVTPDWNVTPDSDDTFTIYAPEGMVRPAVNAVAWNGGALPTVGTSTLTLGEVQSELSSLSSHGDSTWSTAVGFATSGDVAALAGYGDLNWSTATGFSTHSASDVVTALGTGSTLTACLTATGFASSADISALQSHGDSSWATATGFAVSADIPSVSQIWAGLNAAQLAKFATVDTGQTTASAGSVSKLSQSEAGGDATEANQETILAAIEALGSPQQAGEEVTLPVAPPAGYGGSGIAITGETITIRDE